VPANVGSSQCQQEAAAAVVMRAVQHVLKPHVEPVTLVLQLEIHELVIHLAVPVGAERLDQLQQQCVQQLSARRLVQTLIVNPDWVQPLQVLLDDSEPMVQCELQLRTPSFPRQLWLPWLQLPLQHPHPHKVLPVSLLGPYLETAKGNHRLSI
jgi:hypothetical protein